MKIEEKNELLDWVGACQSSYHIDSTPGHRFGGLHSALQENRDGLVEYVDGMLAAVTAERDTLAAQVAQLRKDLASATTEIACFTTDVTMMRQTMAAAAEEISEHWDAHCDESGYGPVSLQHRLEGQYGVNYPGYTLGAFQKLIAERDAALAQLAETKTGAQAGPEELAERFIAAEIDRAPEPLRRLGEYLASALDEDQFKTASRMLLGAIEAAHGIKPA